MAVLDVVLDDDVAAWRQRVVDGVQARLRELVALEARRWLAVDPWLDGIVSALNGSVTNKGKRLRPLFCAAGFLAAGGQGTWGPLIDVGSALELLHGFALLHDDVMDGSATRRGQPTFHRQVAEAHARDGLRGEPNRYGEGMAVLVGDLAFSLAQRLMAGAPPRAQGVWHEMCTELVMGQYLDMAGGARGQASAERALAIAHYKSGAYTVGHPLHMGAYLSEPSPEALVTLSRFARPLGEAFQLHDDLLGAFGDQRQTGKPSGDDLRQGKPTLLLALARQRANPGQAALLERVGRPGFSDSDLAAVREWAQACGARSEVEALVERRYTEAIAALAGAGIPARAKLVLTDLAGRALAGAPV